MSRRLIPAKPRSNADIEGLVLAIIKRYQPEVLNNGERFDVERFFDCELEAITGVKIDYQPLGYGIYGYTDSDMMISVISRDLIEEPRQKYFCRSTMAHEIGHAILHVSDYKRAKAILKSIHNKDHTLRMYYEKELKPYMNPEWQAWRFAGALLMPAPVTKEAIMKGNSINNMSQRFGVNPAFVKSRVKALTKIRGHLTMPPYCK